jgi:hypothetical protein
MEDYTKYTLEGACSLFITIVAYKIYKMRCNTSSKCCGDRFESDLHNDGTGNNNINNIAL